MGDQTLYFVSRYRILIDASYKNEKRNFPLSPAQIHAYDFQVEKLFLEILKRNTGQIIAEGTFSSGRSVFVQPYSNKPGAKLCNPQTWGMTMTLTDLAHGSFSRLMHHATWTPQPRISSREAARRKYYSMN
jgi:hypothetical protein